jgi:hypothetical protein
MEVATQQIWRDVECLIAVRQRLAFARSFNVDRVFKRRAPDAAMTDLQSTLSVLQPPLGGHGC